MGNQSSKQHHIGGGKPKKFVHWKSAERPSPPGRPILIPLSDQQPDVITLKWEKPRTDGGSPILGYVVEHRRTGSPHWVRATPALATRTEASISGLEPGWRYQFRVIAENVIGKSDPSELSDALTVTLQRNAITVPRFVSELKDATAVENERIEMRVSVVGQPPPEINWFKDGFEIFSSRRTKIVNENDSSILIIHQVAFTDEGEIKCTATNRAGHVVTKAHLKIEAPPKIRLPRQYEDGLIVEADEVLRLKVGLAGQPSPSVIWSHENTPIHNGGRFELVTTEKNSGLKINNVKRFDRGEYTLRAINKLGEDVASFLVTVTAKPTPPGQVRLTMSFGRSATLIWTAPEDDGGCKIGNYIVEYFRVGWNVWLKAATTRKLTVTLHDLIEGSVYKFRVKAENPYGLSDPSVESETLFVPDSKRGIAQPEITTEEIVDSPKPKPPKRRNLSPLRHLVSRISPSRDVSPGRNVQLIPEIYGNEDLKREMSYGTPNEVLDPRELRRKESLKMEEEKALLSRSPSSRETSGKVIDGQHGKEELEVKPNLERRGSGMLEISQKVQDFFKRSPSPGRRLENSIEKHLKDVKKSPEQKKGEESDKLHANQRKSSFFKRSPSPDRRQISKKEDDPNSGKTHSSGKQSDHQSRVDDLSPKLGINQKVQQFFRRSPSPARSIHKEDLEINKSPSLKKKEQSAHRSPKAQKKEEPMRLDINQNVQSFFRRSSSPGRIDEFSYKESNYESSLTRSESLKRSQEPVKDDRNDNFLIREMRASSPNPTIRIIAPEPELPLGRELQTQSKTDEVHTSSEFMLVLYHNKKSKEHEKHDSFDLELEESLAPPPLSLSSPELATDMQYLELQQLKRSYSSTELLYERAMAKFYDAVELEEAENHRKRKLSQDQSIQEPIRKRLGSIGESERLSFERRSSLRRRLSGEIPQNIKSNSKEFVSLAKTGIIPSKKPSLEQQRSYDDEMEFSDEEKKTERRHGSVDYDEDYSESTASSEDSIEKFKIELAARTRPQNDEMDTYHPRNMDMGTFSPYRSPKPDQSSVILTKPVPLPDPDFIPKPILKRSSSESVSKDSKENINEINNKVILEPQKSESKGKGFKAFFKREKVPSDQSLPKKKDKVNKANKNDENGSPNLKQNGIKGNTLNMNNNADENMPKQSKVEETRKRVLDSRKSSEEEAKVVIDHYSDIVRELGSSRKSAVPLYLNSDELKKAAEEAEWEEGKLKPELIDASEQLLIERSKLHHRLSIVERIQVSHVQNKSKLAFDKPITRNDSEQKKSDDEEEKPKIIDIDNKSPIVRGRAEAPKKIKKRTSSSTRSRDNSLARPPDGTKPNDTPTPKRIASRSRTRNASKSPGPLKRKIIKTDNILNIHLPIYTPPPMNFVAPDSRPHTPDELMNDQAQENVRSTLSYLTDLGLFLVACWVYIFKDARLVIPILALLVYRQLGEVLRDQIPKWISRKNS